MQTDIQTPAGEIFAIKDIGVFLRNTVSVALIITAIITLFFLLWGAIDWISSGGDKNKYEEAQKKITTAVIGLAIVAAAWLIWTLILYFLGIGDISQNDVVLPIPPP